MTAQSRDYLRTRFEQLDVPTAQDFQDLIDSFELVGGGFWIDADDGNIWSDAAAGDPFTE
jgi:hypothetical protein